MLTIGEEDRPYEAAADNPSRIFSASTRAEAEESLQRFFFDRIGLRRLSWVLSGSHDNGESRDAGTSWLTYFQALVIPDGGDRYLLCDPAHAMGNQQGLIFSAFLGLRLVEQLNRLGTESAKIKKREEHATGERKSVEDEIETLNAELKVVRDEIQRIDGEQQGRRGLYERGHSQERFATVQDTIAERLAEEETLRKDREGITDRIAFTRASEIRIREYIALKLHFTGLDVRLCPNCDAEVSDKAIAKEQESHECRLCHKAAHAAAEGELEGRRAEADALAQQLVEDESRRRRVNARLEQIRTEVVRLRQEGKDLEEALKTDVASVLPTVVEQSERDRLLQEAGRLAGGVSAKKAKLDTYEAQGEDGEKQARILRKVREVLQEEAESRNKTILTRLNELTQEVSSLIGAESISDVTCSALAR